MPKKTAEETHVDNITKGIQLIMNKKKTPKEVNLSKSFERLKALNKPLYHDLMNDYKAATIGIPTMD